MKKRVFAALLLAALLCGIWTVSATAATYATVVGGWLRLRVGPSYNAKVIVSYRNGSVVTVLDQQNGWCRVITSDYRVGYMDQRYLLFEGNKPDIPDPTPPKPSRTWTDVNRTAWVTSQNGKGVRLRNAPAVYKNNVLGLYPVGRTVAELKVSSDGWSYIQIDGKYGYMMSKFLTTGRSVPPPSGGGSGTAPQGGGSTPPSPGGCSGGLSLSGVLLNNPNPRSGDTLRLTVRPEGIRYSVVWYRSGTKVLLSTNNSYTVNDADVGSSITVRVTGSDGTVAEVSTSTVTAAASSSSSSAGTASFTVETSVTLPGGTSTSGGDLPDFVRWTMEQGGVAVQAVPSGSSGSGDF